MTLPVRALILARLSLVERIEAEDGSKTLDEEAIRDQVADLVAHAAEIGWGIGPAATYIMIENDVPSYHSRMVTMPDGRRERRPKRPVFWEALAMLSDGRADGLVIVDTDRVTRHPRDGEDLIDVVELHGVQVTSMTSGDLNLNTGQGRSDLRQRIAHASWSSADTARRVAAKRKRLSLAGKRTGSPRRFGWLPGNIELDSWRWEGPGVPPLPGDPEWTEGEPVPGSEAAELRSMADQVLHGVSLRQVALDLRTRGIGGAQGGQWESSSVRWALLHPAIMGRLTYRPAHPAGVPRTNASRLFTAAQIKGTAPWPPVVTEAEYWALQSILTDSGRKDTPGNVPRWLLSLIAVCGECETGTVSVNSRSRGNPSYRCRKCSARHGSRPELVDAYVSMIIIRRLARADAADLIPRKAPPAIDVRELERERAALKVRKASQARMHGQGLIDDDELAEGSAAIRERLSNIDAQLDAGPRSPLETIAGRADAEQIWEFMPLGLRREIIRAVVTVTLIRTPNVSSFDPGTVVIGWHA